MTIRPMKRHRSCISATIFTPMSQVSSTSSAFVSAVPNLRVSTLSSKQHVCNHHAPFHSTFITQRPLQKSELCSVSYSPVRYNGSKFSIQTPNASLLPPRDSLRDVPESVVRAVEKLSSSAPRITVADVAAAAGIELSNAQTHLVTLAALTAAPIDVTSDGNLAYRFPRNVRSRLRNSSIRASIRMAFSRVAPLLFTAARISFGALLLISLLVTLIALAVLSGAASSSRSSDDDSRMPYYYNRRPFYSPFRWYAPDIFDLIIYGRARTSPTGEPSFLEAIYSWVFGDGDPNSKLEDQRWQAVATLIRDSGGAVTAEQLAPLLEPDMNVHFSNDDSNLVDESFVLPALVRFNGSPQVTSDGNIIYVFSEFMQTGDKNLLGANFTRKRRRVSNIAISALREIPLVLSRTATPQRALVLALGALNFFAVVSLGAKLFTVVAVTPDAANFVAGIQKVYPGLLAYAASFWLVPLVRWIRLRRINRDITNRNAARELAASRLTRPSTELRQKILAAQSYAKDAEVVGGNNVVYSSDMDAIDQINTQEDLAKDFDRRLNGRL